MTGRTDRHGRGQVGVGTLLVFLALALVVTVAAGTLVETGGQLQSRAADAGDRATAEVSTRVSVVSATGVDDTKGKPNPTEFGQNGEIDTIHVYVTLSPGAEAVDLSDATIQYTSNNERATLTYARGTSFNEDSFIVAGFGEGGYQGPRTVLNSTDDVYRITILPYRELPPGADASITIIGQSGAATTYEVDVPTVVNDRYEPV